MPISIVLIFLFFIVIGLFLDVLILNWLTKKFNVSNVTLKTTVKIFSLQLAIGLLIGIILNIVFSTLNLQIIFSISSPFIGFYIFHRLFNKYYKTELKQNIKIYLFHLLSSLLLAIILIIFIRTFIFQPFTIKGDSMNPTLKNSDYVFLKMYDKDYHRGDIIIYKDPKDERVFNIKRIIGLPGETIEMKDGQIYIIDSENRVKLEEPYESKEMITSSLSDQITILKQNQYYVLGDNREVQKVYGAIDESLIFGKYWFTGLSH
jgi:signal peptidase I